MNVALHLSRARMGRVSEPGAVAEEEHLDDAEIVIVEFGDFECPHCQKLWNSVEEYTRTTDRNVAIGFTLLFGCATVKPGAWSPQKPTHESDPPVVLVMYVPPSPDFCQG